MPVVPVVELLPVGESRREGRREIDVGDAVGCEESLEEAGGALWIEGSGIEADAGDGRPPGPRCELDLVRYESREQPGRILGAQGDQALERPLRRRLGSDQLGGRLVSVDRQLPTQVSDHPGLAESEHVPQTGESRAPGRAAQQPHQIGVSVQPAAHAHRYAGGNHEPVADLDRAAIRAGVGEVVAEEDRQHEDVRLELAPVVRVPIDDIGNPGAGETSVERREVVALAEPGDERLAVADSHSEGEGITEEHHRGRPSGGTARSQAPFVDGDLVVKLDVIADRALVSRRQAVAPRWVGLIEPGRDDRDGLWRQPADQQLGHDQSDRHHEDRPEGEAE